MGREWGVYRLYARDGRLLYVGKGHNGALDRLKQHRTRRWGRYIHTRMWEPYPTEQAALAAERQAIRVEAPMFNKQHNRGRNRPDEHRLMFPRRTPRAASAWYSWAAAGPLVLGLSIVVWVVSR